MQNLKIVYREIHSIHTHEYNFRKHSSEVIEQLKKSITEHGVVDPIIINSSPSREGIIISGEMRWKACIELGHTTVPCVEISISDIEKEKALILRLNAIKGDWNEEVIKTLDEVFLMDVGFESKLLEEIFYDTLDTQEDSFDITAEIKKIKKPKSKTGNLYQLGSHRLICGSSDDSEVIKRLVQDEKMDMIYNDPIYNLSVNYDTGLSKGSKYGGKERDKRTDTEYEDFIRKTMQNALEVSSKDVHVFYYSDQKYASMMQRLYEELGIKFQRTCLWLKAVSNPTPQIAFSKIYEPVTYGVRGKPFINKTYTNFNELLNKEFTNGHCVIEQFYDLIDVWAVKRLSGNQYEHPTEKPVTLHDKPIKRCTKIGDNILSMFGGSGGEMISAEQLKRKVFMVEKDPIFVDLIIRRFEKFTNTKAILISRS